MMADLPGMRGGARFMRRALTLAERGWGHTAPNPMVGAVLVKDAKIVGQGFHAGFGREHAEVAALRSAGENARSATMYVNLEPCNHVGKTGPCAQAIVDAGVSSVIVSTLDPNSEAAGGMARMRRAGIQVAVGLEAEAARELNAPFFNRFSSDRPFTTLKLAMSLDGAVADHARSPGWLSSSKSLRMVHRMRAGVDAIGVGLGTVLADDPSLTVRGRSKSRVPPVRIVFARAGAFPVQSRLARTAASIPTYFVTTSERESEARELEKLGVRVVRVRDLGEGMRILFREGIGSLLVEGGAQLAASMLDSGLLDRLTIIRAPIILGSGGLNAFSSARPRLVASALRMRVVATRMLDSDSVTTYAVSPL